VPSVQLPLLQVIEEYPLADEPKSGVDESEVEAEAVDSRYC